MPSRHMVFPARGMLLKSHILQKVGAQLQKIILPQNIGISEMH
jgi:hypothetical protein